MTKKLAALAAVLLLLLSQRPHAQAPASGHAGIYFVDIGQGASTLIVSPTGKTLLVDGGPSGAGTNAVIPLLNTLGISTINYTVLTHYHIDHDGGLAEVINAGRVNGGIAYDNGDAANLVPPSLTSSTGTAYTAYKNALAAHGVTRQTINPGDVIDLGGGMYATCLVAGGRLLSGGLIPINNDDLNSESISLKVEFNNFDFLISGDLTGGGSTSSEKTPDVETYAGQLAGDVDVVQLNHHGSTTTSNQRFLSAVKAEVAVAEAGSFNTFGHPNRETVNKYLNTPVTGGRSFTGTGVPAPGAGPAFYSPEQSPAGDDRVTQQEYTGATIANAGHGTILLDTDGTTSYTLKSVEDGGARINPALHEYPVDGVSPGITTDFPPTVVPALSPEVPLAGDAVTVSAAVSDRESPIGSVTLTYSINGVLQAPLAMALSGATYRASIPAESDGTRVDYTVSAMAGGDTTSISGGYFAGVTPITSLHAVSAVGEPLYAGYVARIQGVVTAPSNTFGAATNDDYVQDATGGINVYRSTDPVTPFTSTVLGQTVQVRGVIGFNGGRLRLDVSQSTDRKAPVPYPYGITSLGAGPAPAPQVVTIADLNASPEAYEGALVALDGCAISAGSIPPPPQSFDAFATVTCGVDSFSLKIDHDTDIQGFAPAEPFTLEGIVQQDDYLRPFNTGYNIAPRNRTDLGGVAAVVPLVAIADARRDADLNFVPDLLGHAVRVQGTVTSINFRPAGTEYYIQDGTGGIDLFSTTPFDALNIGDSVEASGVVSQFNGLTELTLSSVSVLTSGAPPAPQVVTLSQLADGGAGEAFEGQLIQVNNVVVTGGTFPAAGAAGNVTIADASGSVVLRISAATDIAGTPAPTTPFSVIALASQFDSAAPFDSGYQILPRGLADIVAGTAVITATPTPLNFGPVNVGTPSSQTVTITNVSGGPVTLTVPFAESGADAAQFTVGAPASTSLPAGGSTTASVTFTPLSIGVKNASVSIQSSSGGIAAVALTGTGQSSGGGTGTGIVISEFRFRGPSGGNDEFVELYNNSDSSIDISGWLLKGSNNAATTSTRATVPGAAGSGTTVVPARRHYLFTNSGASGYSGLVPGNVTYATGITDDGGVAITKADDTIVDQAGMSTGSAFKEGAVLTPLTTNTNQGYERKLGGVEGSQVDSNNNATDFQVRAPSDPQNLASAPTPAISALPVSVNFGSVAAGASTTAALTITNNSALPSPVTVTLTPPFTISGTDAGAFSVSAPGVTSLAAGASTTATLTFHPSSSGPRTATLTITSSNGTRTVSLNGSGAAGITLSPAAFDFGEIPLGGSASTTIAITNAASSTVTLTPPFAITGPNAAEFSVDAPSAAVLASEDTASVAVSVHSTSLGPKSATLTVSSANGGSPSVTLTASTCPTIAIAGSLPGGFLGIPYSQTLTASGGAGSYAFTIASGIAPGGMMLAPGGLFSGTPIAAGSFAFTVKATDANGCSGTAPYTVAIGTATLTGTPNPLGLGTVHVGTTASSPVTIRNTSSFSVTLTPPFTVTGTDAANFSVGSPATTTLAAGATTTASVSFSPGSGGIKNATLTLTSSSGGAATVALSGTGDSASVGNGILISEFRFRGPGLGNDEFIELYNSTGSPIAVGGYILKGSNGVATIGNRATVTAGTMIGAHGHYLLVNSAAPAALTALANQTYSSGITDDGGVAITLPDGTIVDQVGLSAGSAFKEGTPLASVTASVNQSYERKPGGAGGSGMDTNNNAADFQLIAPNDPQNLSSPVVPALFGISSGSVDFGSVALGSSALSILTITNNSTVPVTLTPPFAIAGANAAEFTAAAPVSTTLAGGAFTSVEGTFTPAALGSRNATLTIGSLAGGSLTVALSGTGTCPTITLSSSLPDGTFNTLYSATVTANGGSAPYDFSTTAGTPPDGLSFGSNGALGGTPGAAGIFTFNVQATDALGCTGTASYSVEIGRAPVTVSWSKSAPIVYGTPLGAGQLTATAGTAGSFVYVPPAGTVLGAGAGQRLSVTFAPLDAANYDPGAATAFIDVAARPLTVTADAKAKVYGAADPPLTYQVTSGALVGSDTFGGGLARAAGDSVGSYTISQGTLALGGNYALTFVPSSLSITRAPLTVTADNQTKVSGDPLPPLTASYGGFVNGENLATSGVTGVPALATTATPASPAGAYPITVAAGTLAATNYAFTFVPGTLTVTPAPPDGRMFGSGFIDDGTRHHHVRFRVTQNNSRDSGRFEYWVRARSPRDEDDDDAGDGDRDGDYGRDHHTVLNRFEATAVTAVTFSDDPAFRPGSGRAQPAADTVVFVGTGKWNGTSGYTFEARAADHGEPGRNRDIFSVVIRNSAGAVVATVNDTIDGGNIQSTRLQ